MKKTKILIVGGVAGGASAAARLRRLNEMAEIILFEKGEYISFANCGLPYYIGGKITEKSSLTLQTPESFYNRFRVDVRIQQEIIAVDSKKKIVRVQNHRTGESYTESYDKLILSPGAEAIKPPINGLDHPAVFTLRNIPDTYRIKEYMDKKSPRRVVIVGGGYIGVEMAENLHHAGLLVTVVEMQDQLIAPLDYDMASSVHRHMEEKGVTLLLSTAVKGVSSAEDGLLVTLDNGSLETDMIILAIGVKPEGQLAEGAELTMSQRGSIAV
ncbi:MAG: NAD(P)/FAD-dependent oxidoreductase, partial [Lachnospiraceae bacterium]